MKLTVEELKKLGYDLTSMNALELFARTGGWQTEQYAKEVSNVTAWEIDKSFQKDLENNLPPGSHIEIGNSHELIKKTRQRYKLIVSDNPMGCYGNYCEHFDILDDVFNVMSDKAILCLNVKTKPFNYDNKKQWQKRRNHFYNRKDASNLSKDFVVNFYKDFAEKKNKKVSHVIWKKRPQEEGLYLLTLCIEEIKCTS